MALAFLFSEKQIVATGEKNKEIYHFQAEWKRIFSLLYHAQDVWKEKNGNLGQHFKTMHKTYEMDFPAKSELWKSKIQEVKSQQQ